MTWKKWLKRTILAVGAYLILQTAWLVCERQWRWSKGNREVAQAFAETEATDPSWQWDALGATRKIPTPEKNAANLIPRIMALLPPERAGVESAKKWEPNLPPLEPNQLFPADVIQSLRKDLTAARKAIDLARALKDLPEGNRVIHVTPDVMSTPLPDTQNTRLVASLLRWDTILAVTEADKNRAADDLAALLNVSRSIGDEPFLISQLIRLATRVIAARALEWVLGQMELSEQSLCVLQQAWASDADEPLLVYGFRGERALLDVLFQNMAEGVVGGNEVKDFSFGTYAWWLYRGRIPRERAFMHRYMTAAVEVARLPAHEQPAALSRMPAMPTENMRFAQLLLPAVERVAQAHWRALSETRCIVVGLACERFRLKHGRWPETLAEIPGDVLDSIPLDPFNGQPLRYRHMSDGVAIYSVGEDHADNAGKIAREPRQEPGTDRGIRLWNPTERGKAIAGSDARLGP